MFWSILPLLATAIVFLSLNYNGLRDDGKRRFLLKWVASINPTFVCLQETHALSDEKLSGWFGSLVAASHRSRKSTGVAMFASRSSSISVLKVWRDDEGRFACAEVFFRGAQFRISLLYFPNRNPARNDFFDGILPLLDPLAPNVIAGDFNSVSDLVRDQRGGNPSSTYDSVERLTRLAHVSSTVDLWRTLHPSSSAFTWSNPDSSISSRIDRIYCPATWLDGVSSSRIIACP